MYVHIHLRVCTNKAVAAHESKKNTKNAGAEGEHPDDVDHEAQSDPSGKCEVAEEDVDMQECAQEDVALQDCEVAQGDVSHQECEVAQGDAAQECEVAQGDVSQECEVAQGDVAHQDQECEVAQGDVSWQECDKALGGFLDGAVSPIPEGVLARLVQHYAVNRPANPEEIHSQVLLRSASELEEAGLGYVQDRPAHLDVPVPDTPLKTPERSLQEASGTPSTVKVYRNTSSYKAAKSPVPFVPDGPVDVHTVCADQGAEAEASGSNQMVCPRELFS